MMFQGDVQKLHEFIKEYLRYAQFEDTFECFDAEIKTKVISKKLDQLEFDPTNEKTPELMKVIKGSSSSSVMAQRRQEQVHEMSERYVDLLAGARQIYSLSVKLHNMCESSKSVRCLLHKFTKEKENKVLLDKLKQAMIKYHRLIIPEEEAPKVEPLAGKELKKLVDSIKKNAEKVDANPEIHKCLVQLRVVFYDKRLMGYR